MSNEVLSSLPAGAVLLRGRIVTPDALIDDGVVVIDGTQVVAVVAADEVPAARRPTATDETILPGLVDLHCHGGAGASFPDVSTVEQAMQAAGEHLRHGTTSLVASLVTASEETLEARVAVLAQLVASGDLAGIHLEGPFLSAARCGAQDPALMQVPSPALVTKLAQQAPGAIVTMTLAPEIGGNTGPDGVAATLISHGAVPSFGHTDAQRGEVRAALSQSAHLLAAPGTRSARPTVTHLFNGMRPLQHREQGPIPDALAAARRGEAVIELVGDGTHLEPLLVTEVFELVGRENIALVTDAMAAAGMPDGRYRLGSMDVQVSQSVARLLAADGTVGAIAGGTARLLDVVRTTVEGGVPLVDAIHAAATTPAEVLGRTDLGRLVAGARGDVVVVDPHLHPRRVLRAGVVVAQH